MFVRSFDYVHSHILVGYVISMPEKLEKRKDGI